MFEKIGKITVSIIIAIVIGLVAAAAVFWVVPLVPTVLDNIGDYIGIVFGGAYMISTFLAFIYFIYLDLKNGEEYGPFAIVVASVIVGLGGATVIALLLLGLKAVMFVAFSIVPDVPWYVKVVFYATSVITFINVIKHLTVNVEDSEGEVNS